MFKGIAKDYGYTLDYISSLSFAQVDALIVSKSTPMNAAQIERFAELKRERYGIQAC